MKKSLSFISLLFLLSALSACNIPGFEVEPTVDVVATEVAKLLTEAYQGEDVSTATKAPTFTPTVEPDEPTSTPTMTATLTSTPTPTETQNPDAPSIQLGDPDWTEDFSGDSSPWDFNSEQATFAVADGALNLTAKSNANWHSWYVSSPKLQNAYVEATIQMSACSGRDRFGLALRGSSDGQEFYFLGITCDGEWGFFRMAPEVNIHEVISYQSAPPLVDLTSQSHSVGVWMKDSTFTIYLDGEPVGTATDDKLPNAGYTGFMIAYSETPGFTVMVDQLSYWNVP